MKKCIGVDNIFSLMVSINKDLSISTIIFDFGGVIVNLNQEEAVRRFEKMGVIDAKQRLNLYSQSGLFKDLEMGLIDSNEFCRDLSKLTGHAVTYDEAKYAWLGYIRSVPIDRLQFIQQLRKRYRVHLLTNTNPFIQSWARSDEFSIERKPLTDYFDQIYCSYELHTYKPSLDFFKRVLQNEKISASETIFVDDGKANIESASSLGMNVIWANESCNWMNELANILE